MAGLGNLDLCDRDALIQDHCATRGWQSGARRKCYWASFRHPLCRF